MGDTSKGLKVLVVEDDASIREALCDVLRLAGHEAEGAEHGKAGLEVLARDGEPDVILLDLRMPVMNGIEFLCAIAPKKLGSRIIVLTANPQDLPPGTNLPMLAKPYDVERLLRVIDGKDS
jgi:two-component system, chemotaxis family, chemotaxis protein CheY